MDTLIRDPYREAYEAATGLTFEDFEAKRPPDIYYALERGEIDEDRYWRELRRAGISIDVVSFHLARVRGYRWLPGMRKILVELAARTPLVIASNYPKWISDIKQGFLKGLSVDVCSSYELGVRKPAVEFFEKLCLRYRLEPSETVLVDDSLETVSNACGYGLKAIHYTDSDNLRHALTPLGLLS